jgi:hypothetical protein
LGGRLALTEPPPLLRESVQFNVRAAWPRWLAVALYAIGMAYVESASVLYLRTIYGGIDPVGTRRPMFDPIPDFVLVEIGREAATMVMLAAVGWLGGQGIGGRIGAFCVAMGVWDIFYYFFLWLFAGWPGSLLAMDILFLIPLPWWGPVLGPTLAAAVMAVAGAAAMARDLGDGLPRPHLAAWLPIVVGVLLCLAAFMFDALRALPGGIDAAFAARPTSFPWPIYLLGVVVSCYGLVRLLTAD